MALQATSITDIVNLTQHELGPGKMTEVATLVPQHVGWRKIMKQNRIMIRSGDDIRFNLMHTHNDSARAVGVGADDVYNMPDLSTKGVVDWRHITSNYVLEHHIIDMNREPARIVEYAKEQQMGQLVAVAEKFEDRIWRVPAISDTTNFHGIPTYIVKSNTAVTTNNGFNGTVPSGYSLVAGLDPVSAALTAKWSNYATQYNSVTAADLVSKARRAAVYTHWVPPIDDKPVGDYNSGDNYGFYTNYNVIGACEDIAVSQNDNLGPDIASMDGKVLFRRTPLTQVFKLDDDTTNPLYGINWGVLKIVILSGWWGKTTRIDLLPGKHTCSAVHTDYSFNMITYDRRRHFVLATDTTMP